MVKFSRSILLLSCTVVLVMIVFTKKELLLLDLVPLYIPNFDANVDIRKSAVFTNFKVNTTQIQGPNFDSFYLQVYT